MKITEVNAFLVNAGLKNWLFVKLNTDQGITGVGEATTEWCEKAVEMMVKHLERCLLGKDPFDIEAHVQRMYRDTYWGSGVVISSAISGLEQALWDIVGKSLRVPLYELLGGRCRDKITAYVSLSAVPQGLNTLEKIVEAAVKAVRKGYTALKIDPFRVSDILMNHRDVKASIECVEAVREAIGDEIEILIEAHGRLNPVSAVQLAKDLEPFRPFFLEEPIPPGNIDGLSRIASKIKIPIAVGERVFSKFGFREILEKGAAEIIQPDPCHVGGILETKKIAAMAETYQVLVAPHNPNGPVSTAVCAHLSVSMPNFLLLEGLWEWDAPWRDEIVRESIKVEKGYIQVPKRPGLGVELNEDEIAKYPYKEPSQFLWPIE